MNRLPRALVSVLLSIGSSLPLAAAREGTGGDPPAAISPCGDCRGEEVLSLSLEEAILRARAASRRLEQLRALRDGAEAGLEGARAERLPLLDVTAGYTRYSNIPEFSLSLPPPDGSRTLYPNIPDNYAARLGLTLPLYTGGRLSNLITAADRELEAAGRDLDTGSQDLVLETSSDYWNLVTALESEKVLREALGSYDAHLTDARRREKFGMAAKNEVLAVQVERDRAELALLRAANAAEVLRADLARILGLAAGIQVAPSASLERLEPPGEDLAALVREARSSRPDRAAIQARIDAAEARTRVAKADRLPQAQLSAGYDYANPNRRILPWAEEWQETWNASVGLSFRVFDGGRTAAAVAQRTAQAEAARLQMEDLDRRIEFDVTQRFLGLQTASAAVDVAGKSLESARENRRVASDRYRAGLIPSSELLDSEVALLRIGLDRTEALALQRLALAALHRAVGR
jgi:outer membrane protein TolC